jgi:tRNA 2-thiouridine synthesizing protein A
MQIIDLKNLNCPMPVLKAQSLLRKLPQDSTVLLECSDPKTMEDIPSFCRVRHYTLICAEEIDNLFYFKIKV